MSNNLARPYLAAVFTSLVWGLSFLSIKIAVAVIPPMTLALLRFLIASIVLIFLWRLLEPRAKVEKKDLPKLLVAGLVGVTLYFFFENNGVKLLTASVASIVVSTIPVWSLLAEALFEKKKLGFMSILGAALSVFGVYFVVGGGDLIRGGSWLGYIMMLGAAISWVIYNFLTKPLTKKYSQLTIVTFQTLFATASLIPLSLMEFREWRLFNPLAGFNVLYLGVVCSALGYIFYVYSLNHLGTRICTLFINFIPVVTVIAGFLILNERITFLQIAGGMLVVTAVMLASLGNSVSKIRKINKKPG